MTRTGYGISTSFPWAPRLCCSQALATLGERQLDRVDGDGSPSYLLGQVAISRTPRLAGDVEDREALQVERARADYCSRQLDSRRGGVPELHIPRAMARRLHGRKRRLTPERVDDHVDPVVAARLPECGRKVCPWSDGHDGIRSPLSGEFQPARVAVGGDDVGRALRLGRLNGNHAQGTGSEDKH